MKKLISAILAATTIAINAGATQAHSLGGQTHRHNPDGTFLIGEPLPPSNPTYRRRRRTYRRRSSIPAHWTRTKYSGLWNERTYKFGRHIGESFISTVKLYNDRLGNVHVRLEYVTPGCRNRRFANKYPAGHIAVSYNARGENKGYFKNYRVAHVEGKAKNTRYVKWIKVPYKMGTQGYISVKDATYCKS